MTRRKKGCLWIFVILLVLGLGGLITAWMLIPEQVRTGVDVGQAIRIAPKVAVWMLSDPPPPAPPPAPGAPPSASAPAKETVRYVLPDAAWQPEVRALFPVHEDSSTVFRLSLTNPQFVPDPDPKWLRLKLDFLARVTLAGGVEEYPGEIVVRTQLRFNPGRRTVTLANVQLGQLRFTGEAAGLEREMQPMVVPILNQWNGYTVVRLPNDAEGLTARGIALVQDVVVENGQVTVVLGR